MERCDFSSISTCLKNQISESNQINRTGKNQSQNNLILCKTQQSEKTGNNHSAELTSLNGRLQHGYTGHLHVIHAGRYYFGYKKAGTCISI